MADEGHTAGGIFITKGLQDGARRVTLAVQMGSTPSGGKLELWSVLQAFCGADFQVEERDGSIK